MCHLIRMYLIGKYLVYRVSIYIYFTKTCTWSGRRIAVPHGTARGRRVLTEFMIAQSIIVICSTLKFTSWVPDATRAMEVLVCTQACLPSCLSTFWPACLPGCFLPTMPVCFVACLHACFPACRHQ